MPSVRSNRSPAATMVTKVSGKRSAEAWAQETVMEEGMDSEVLVTSVAVVGRVRVVVSSAVQLSVTAAADLSERAEKQVRATDAMGER